MKVIPSNQTLILANERGVSGGRPAAALGDAPRIGSGDSVLQRVTIVAARSDTTLIYLQADYASAEPSSGRAQSVDAPGAVVATILKSGGLADYAFAEPSPQAPRSFPQALNRGVGLYASTQRILAEAPVTVHIDVHA